MRQTIIYIFEFLGIIGLVGIISYITWTKITLGATLTLLGAFFPEIKTNKQEGEGRIQAIGIKVVFRGGLRVLVVISGMFLIIISMADGYQQSLYGGLPEELDYLRCAEENGRISPKELVEIAILVKQNKKDDYATRDYTNKEKEILGYKSGIEPRYFKNSCLHKHLQRRRRSEMVNHFFEQRNFEQEEKSYFFEDNLRSERDYYFEDNLRPWRGERDDYKVMAPYFLIHAKSKNQHKSEGGCVSSQDELVFHCLWRKYLNTEKIKKLSDDRTSYFLNIYLQYSSISRFYYEYQSSFPDKFSIREEEMVKNSILKAKVELELHEVLKSIIHDYSNGFVNKNNRENHLNRMRSLVDKILKDCSRRMSYLPSYGNCRWNYDFSLPLNRGDTFKVNEIIKIVLEQEWSEWASVINTNDQKIIERYLQECLEQILKEKKIELKEYFERENKWYTGSLDKYFERRYR